MKKTNKFLSVLLALIMIVSLIPMSSITASAETITGTCEENITWTFDDVTGTMTISGTGEMPYRLSWDLENYKNDVKTVVINEGITSIGENVFYYFTNLTSVTIPDSVTKIEDFAFGSCTSLTNITIPNSVTTIGEYSFGACKNLTNVVIPDSVTSIGKEAFALCDNLTNVIIGNNVTTIGEMAFASCPSLTNITIPASVTSIGIVVFANCTSLTNILVDNDNQYYSNDDGGVLYNKDKTTLVQYPIGDTKTSYTIPDSVTTIGYGSFANCINLTSANIPDSVTSIEYGSFSNCTNLANIYIPNSVTTIGEVAFAYCYSLKNLVIPNGVTKIGAGAFLSCTELTNVTIPNSMTTIDELAFFYCTSLADVYYSGTEDEWKSITIESNNDPLLNATMHYNCHIHNYESVTVAPACTEQGYTTYTCECGDSYVDNYIDATAHTDSDNNGYCDVCDELLNPTVGCDHSCHKGGISGFFWKITLFFSRLFGLNKYCECGIAHY